MQATTTPPSAPAPVGTSLAASNGVAPAAARARQYEIFEVPEDVPIDQRAVVLDGTRYAITEVWFVLLSLKEDKLIAARAGENAANPVLLAILKTSEALRFVRAAVITSTVDKEGQPAETFNADQAVEFACSSHDGTAEGMFGAMHPGMRDIVMLGYAMSATIGEAQAARFLKSRRTAIR